MGKRVDMAPRAHRRTLVVLIYAGLAVLMTGLWLADGWRTSSVWMILASILVNRLILGGYAFGGLIKPFTGRAPARPVEPPPFLVLGLRLYQPEPGEREFRNDERELRQRDHAHYLAYQVLAVSLIVVWFMAKMRLSVPGLFGFLPMPADLLVYGMILAIVVAVLTLPQAILLWTEPDMEPEA